MAIPYYLVSADSKPLKKIADYARKRADRRLGDPVLVLGSHRIALAPLAVDAILDKDPDQSIAAILRRKGAEGAWPVSHERLRELLSARDPVELTVPRDEGRADDLVRDKLDWHIKVTRLDEAWERVRRDGAIDWRNIRVGQIDTGYREHPCLGWDGRRRKSAFVLTDFDRNFFPRDFEPELGFPIGREDSALDPLAGGRSDGHGVRTASILAGFDTRDAALDSGKFSGFFGAAPCVPHLPVRICDDVIINHVQIPLALAIEHLVQNGCQVITISMGMALTVILRRLRQAIDYGYQNGVIIVCAAGNRWNAVVAPARLNRTIAVAGSTVAMTPWLGSSFGPEVDVSAPAWPVRRASVTRTGEPIYGYGDGTSYATPLVAGTAALWLLHKGDELDDRYPQKWQRVEAFKRVLTATAQPGEQWNTALYGRGILDAVGVLDAVAPDANTLFEDRRS